MLRFIEVDKNNKDDVNILVQILLDTFGDEFKNMQTGYVKSLSNESYIYFVSMGDTIVGTFELKDGNGLASFGILTEFQRKGIGYSVIKKLLQQHEELIIHGDTKKSKGLYAKFPRCKIKVQ